MDTHYRVFQLQYPNSDIRGLRLIVAPSAASEKLAELYSLHGIKLVRVPLEGESDFVGPLKAN